MLKTLLGKWTGRKVLALVGSVSTIVAGESLIDQFPSWIILVLGITYIVVNSAQKFGLGWLDLKKSKA